MSDSDSFYMHQSYTIFDKNAQLRRLYWLCFYLLVGVGVLGISGIVYIARLHHAIEKLTKGVCS